MVRAVTTPGELLNIGAKPGMNRFNLGVGRPTGHTDYSPDKVAAGYTSTPEFVATPSGVRFRVRMDAARTSTNTKYPRSELREFNRDGTRAAWHGGTGRHWMQGATRILHLPPKKPWVCFAQIHDAQSDLIRVQTEGSLAALRIVARNTTPGGAEETVTVMPSYLLGDVITWRLEVVDGHGELIINDKLVRTFPVDVDGCYFKAGAYAQSNSTIDDRDEYVEVEVLAGSLVHWHSGWPQPSRSLPPVPVPPSAPPIPVPVPPAPSVEPPPPVSGPPEKPLEPVPAPTPAPVSPPSCPTPEPPPRIPVWVQALLRALRLRA